MKTPTISEQPAEQSHELDPATGESAPSRGRSWVVGVLLFLAVASALVAGGWGFISSLMKEPAPVRIGEAVEVSGGFMRVDGVTPEHMAPMQADKFAASGMNMSAMGMDMAPEGQRKFVAEVTLAAGKNGALSYSADKFRLTGYGMDETGPLRHQLDEGTLPKNNATSGSLVFEVPEEAENLMLNFDGGTPVALDLPPATEEDEHSHGTGQEEGEGHPQTGEEEQSDHAH